MVQVLLAAPVSEADCERTFSAVKLLVSDLRSTLGEQIIDDVLMIRLNADLILSSSFKLNCKDSLHIDAVTI